MAHINRKNGRVTLINFYEAPCFLGEMELLDPESPSRGVRAHTQCECLVLDLARERYFGLDQVGTRIWTLLGDYKQLQVVCDALCAEYDAEPVRIRDDLLALVGQLAEAGLVKLH